MLVILAVSLSISNNAKAQEKVAFLNINKLTLLMPEAKEIQKQMSEIDVAYNSKMRTMRGEYERKLSLYSKEASQVSGEKNSARQKELKKLEKEMNEYHKATKASADALNSKLILDTQSKIKKAVEKVAKANGYAIVMHISDKSNIVFGDYQALLDSNLSFEAKVKRELGL